MSHLAQSPNWGKLKLRIPRTRIKVVFSENGQNTGSLPFVMAGLFHMATVDVIPGTTNGVNKGTVGQPQVRGRDGEETGLAGVGQETG